MFIPGGCFCCEPPEDPCVLSGCTWSSTDMSDTDLTAAEAYHNAVNGATPDGTYEITNYQDAANGNDPACRRIIVETVSAPASSDAIYAICWKDNATHNPSTQCPLTNVSFCVESKRHGDSNPGSELSDGVVFVVRQSGKIYATAMQSVGVNWKRASGTYTSGQFTWISGAGNPNFTATGASIEFGFALRLNVGADEEPLDMVLFDNLCITRTTNCGGGGSCGCNAGCFYLNEGDSGASVSNTYGTGTVSYSVDTSIGCTAPSHKVQFTGLTGSGPWTSLAYLLFDEVISFGGCQSVTSQVCMLVKAQREYTAPSTGGAFGHRIAYYQAGQWFICGSERLLGGTYNPGNLPSQFLKIEESAGGTNWKRINPAAFNGSLSTSTVGTGWFPSTGPDLTDDFQIGSILMTNATDGTTVTGWFDNICVKPVYGCPAAAALSDNLMISFDGDFITDNSGQCGPTVDYINSTVSGGVVLTRLSPGGNIWGYTLSFPSPSWPGKFGFLRFYAYFTPGSGTPLCGFQVVFYMHDGSNSPLISSASSAPYYSAPVYNSPAIQDCSWSDVTGTYATNLNSALVNCLKKPVNPFVTIAQI